MRALTAMLPRPPPSALFLNLPLSSSPISLTDRVEVFETVLFDGIFIITLNEAVSLLLSTRLSAPGPARDLARSCAAIAIFMILLQLSCVRRYFLAVRHISDYTTTRLGIDWDSSGTGDYLPPSRVRRRTIYVMCRFASHAPHWQFVKWAQLFIISGARIVPEVGHLVHAHLEDAYTTLYEPGPGTKWGPYVAVLLTLLISLHLHVVTAPYPFLYQNRLEARLYVSSVCLMLLGATLHMSEDHPTATAFVEAVTGLLIGISFGSIFHTIFKMHGLYAAIGRVQERWRVILLAWYRMQREDLHAYATEQIMASRSNRAACRRDCAVFWSCIVRATRSVKREAEFLTLHPRVASEVKFDDKTNDMVRATDPEERAAADAANQGAPTDSARMQRAQQLTTRAEQRTQRLEERERRATERTNTLTQRAREREDLRGTPEGGGKSGSTPNMCTPDMHREERMAKLADIREKHRQKYEERMSKAPDGMNASMPGPAALPRPQASVARKWQMAGLNPLASYRSLTGKGPPPVARQSGNMCRPSAGFNPAMASAFGPATGAARLPRATSLPAPTQKVNTGMGRLPRATKLPSPEQERANQANAAGDGGERRTRLPRPAGLPAPGAVVGPEEGDTPDSNERRYSKDTPNCREKQRAARHERNETVARQRAEMLAARATARMSADGRRAAEMRASRVSGARRNNGMGGVVARASSRPPIRRPDGRDGAEDQMGALPQLGGTPWCEYLYGEETPAAAAPATARTTARTTAAAATAAATAAAATAATASVAAAATAVAIATPATAATQSLPVAQAVPVTPKVAVPVTPKKPAAKSAVELVPDTPLPTGWTEAVAPNGRTYYYHLESGTTQWSRPREAPLPDGWTKATAPNGQTYYYHRESGVTQWVRPVKKADESVRLVHV